MIYVITAMSVFIPLRGWCFSGQKQGRAGKPVQGHACHRQQICHGRGSGQQGIFLAMLFD
jgi:hypothetical protein